MNWPIIPADSPSGVWRDFEVEERRQLGFKGAVLHFNLLCAEVKDLAFWERYEETEHYWLVEEPQRRRR
jgi:hypothetical protein